MPAQIDYFYLFVILCALLGVLLGISAIANLILLRRTVSLKEENLVLSKDLRLKLNQLILEMTKRSLEEIKAAGEAAKDIVHKTEFFSAETKQQFLADLTIIREEQKKNYGEALEEAQKQMSKSFDMLSIEVESDVKKYIDEFKGGLLKEYDLAKQEAEKKVLTYQSLLIQRVENQFYDQFIQLTKEVLNKSIAPDDHETLLFDALKEAKLRNVF